MPVSSRHSIYTIQTLGIYKWPSEIIESKSKQMNTSESEEHRDEGSKREEGEKMKENTKCEGAQDKGKAEKQGVVDAEKGREI